MLILNALGLLLFVLVAYWQRFNKPFTRRIKRKPVAVQKHRFSPKPQWVIDAMIRLKVFMPSAGVRMIAMTVVYRAPAAQTSAFEPIYSRRNATSL